MMTAPEPEAADEQRRHQEPVSLVVGVANANGTVATREDGEAADRDPAPADRVGEAPGEGPRRQGADALRR